MLRIEFNGKEFSEEQLRDSRLLQNILRASKEIKKYPICLCNDKRNKLVVRKVNKCEHTLCLWPNSGPVHDKTCHFYKDEGDQRKKIEAIIELKNGWEVKPEFGINMQKTAETTGIGGISRGGGGSSRAGLKQILRFMWEEIGLYGDHGFEDEPIYYEAVAESIRALSENINLSNKTLSDILYIPKMDTDGAGYDLYAEFEHLALKMTGVTDYGEARNRFIMLGLWHSLKPYESNNDFYRLMLYKTKFSLSMPAYIGTKLQRKLPRDGNECDYSLDKEHKYWVISLVEPTKKENKYFFNIKDICIEKMTKSHFLPN